MYYNIQKQCWNGELSYQMIIHVHGQLESIRCMYLLYAIMLYRLYSILYYSVFKREFQYLAMIC